MSARAPFLDLTGFAGLARAKAGERAVAGPLTLGHCAKERCKSTAKER